MAGDWIKISVGLRTHPKVVRMASALKADRLRILGGLQVVWSIFDQHSPDGVLHGYTLATIDEELGFRGFGNAMQAVGWLEEIGEGLVAPRFDEHNGASAKRRAMEASRKGRSRKQSTKIPTDESPHGSGTKSGQVSAFDADKMRNREEKRREDKPVTTPTTVTRTTGCLQPIAGAALEELRATPSTADDPGQRGILHAVCAANNVKANAFHPQIVEWARAGVTQDQLRDAIVQARISKPPDVTLTPAYLAPIVERIVAGKGNGSTSQAWKVDDDAAIKTGAKLGVKPKPGEDFHHFRQRISDAMATSARQQVR